MRYWWVNQNQTFDQEISGGYLWSPKRNVDGGRNPFYESMREIAPGDLILSFKGTFIQAVGVAQSNCYECPKPAEFGNAGAYWERVGWKVDVHYHILTRQLRPRDHMSALGSLLPEKYSPLQISGRGNQGVYLTELPTMLMATLVNLIGNEAEILMMGNYLSESPADYHKKNRLSVSLSGRSICVNSLSQTRLCKRLKRKPSSLQGVDKDCLRIMSDGLRIAVV